MERPLKKYAPAFSVYLGPPDTARKRLAALDGLAKSLGVSRSEMMQMLADGKFLLVVNPST